MTGIGETLPAIVLEDHTGTPVDLRDHHGGFFLVQCLRYYG